MSRRYWAAFLMWWPLALVACGGGDGGDSDLAAPVQGPESTARFAVDLESKTVTVTPLGRACFDGSAIGFEVGPVAQVPHQSNLFRFEVGLKNTYGSALGESPGGWQGGLRVMIGPPIVEPKGSSSIYRVDLVDRDGLYSGAGQHRPYFNYPGRLNPDQTTAPRTWTFGVGSAVRRFEFEVSVAADTTSSVGPQPELAKTGRIRIRTICGTPIYNVSYQYADGAGTQIRMAADSIAIDRTGVVYLAEQFAHTVRRLDRDGQMTTIAGAPFQAGSANGAGTTARFNGPYGLEVADTGDVVYVSDSDNNRLRRISLRAGADPKLAASWRVTTIAGDGRTDTVYDGPGDQANFNLPGGLCLGAGPTLYVVEMRGNRVRQVRYMGGDPAQPQSWRVSTLAGPHYWFNGPAAWVDGAADEAYFSQPSDCCLDAEGNVYVADGGNHKIRKITPQGRVSTYAGGPGQPNPGAADGAFSTARLTLPVGVDIDRDGALWITQPTGNLRRVDRQQVTRTALSSAQPVVDGLTPTARGYNLSGVAVADGGEVYFTDARGSVLRVAQPVVTAPQR